MSVLRIHSLNLGQGESAAMQEAVALLASELEAASGKPWQVQALPVASAAQCQRSPAPIVIVTSLIGEVDQAHTPWPEVEARLRADYAALAAMPGLMLFVCTILRHVPSDLPDGGARLVRLRRLNSLAMELSQCFGACVIDLDRALADIGARTLDTDYRLGGGYAAAAAARAIAMTLLAAGLDDHIPYTVQDVARDRIEARPVQLADTDLAAARTTARAMNRINARVGEGNLSAMKAGRRMETAAIITGNPKTGMAQHLAMLRSGKLRMREVLPLFFWMVGRWGIGGTVRRLVSFGIAAGRLIGKKAGQQ